MHSFQKIYLALFVALLALNACSNETTTESTETSLPEEAKSLTNLTVFPENTEPQFDIELIAEQNFGEPDSIYISHVKDIITDDQNRVIIADGAYGKCKIHVFNPDGSYLKTVGRNGRGPGEFLSLEKLFILNNNLYVLDRNMQRISVFSLSSFELLKTIDTKPDYLQQIEGLQSSSPYDFYLRDDGNFLVGLGDPRQIQKEDIREDSKYYIFNEEWEINSEQIFSRIPYQYFYSATNNSPSISTYSFMNRSLMDVAKDGAIFSAWSQNILIKVHDPNGNYLRSFYYPFTHSKLNEDDIINRFDEAWKENNQEGIKRWKARARTVDYPEIWPAIHDLVVDDENRIWIATITDSKTHFEWWVLDEHGKLLAKFDWPGKKVGENIGYGKTMKINNGYLYNYIFQKHDGSRLVTRYRIELKPKS
jgi:hypothetical protein